MVNLEILFQITLTQEISMVKISASQQGHKQGSVFHHLLYTECILNHFTQHSSCHGSHHIQSLHPQEI